MERTSRGHIVNYNESVAKALVDSVTTDHSKCRKDLIIAEKEYQLQFDNAVYFAGEATRYRRRACQWKSLAIALALVVLCMAVWR